MTEMSEKYKPLTTEQILKLDELLAKQEEQIRSIFVEFWTKKSTQEYYQDLALLPAETRELIADLIALAMRQAMTYYCPCRQSQANREKISGTKPIKIAAVK